MTSLVRGTNVRNSTLKQTVKEPNIYPLILFNGIRRSGVMNCIALLIYLAYVQYNKR